jgi:hypothetical protein
LPFPGVPADYRLKLTEEPILFSELQRLAATVIWPERAVGNRIEDMSNRTSRYSDYTSSSGSSPIGGTGSSQCRQLAAVVAGWPQGGGVGTIPYLKRKSKIGRDHVDLILTWSSRNGNSSP